MKIERGSNSQMPARREYMRREKWVGETIKWLTRQNSAPLYQISNVDFQENIDKRRICATHTHIHVHVTQAGIVRRGTLCSLTERYLRRVAQEEITQLAECVLTTFPGNFSLGLLTGCMCVCVNPYQDSLNHTQTRAINNRTRCSGDVSW